MLFFSHSQTFYAQIQTDTCMHTHAHTQDYSGVWVETARIITGRQLHNQNRSSRDKGSGA